MGPAIGAPARPSGAFDDRDRSGRDPRGSRRGSERAVSGKALCPGGGRDRGSVVPQRPRSLPAQNGPARMLKPGLWSPLSARPRADHQRVRWFALAQYRGVRTRSTTPVRPSLSPPHGYDRTFKDYRPKPSSFSLSVTGLGMTSTRSPARKRAFRRNARNSSGRSCVLVAAIYGVTRSVNILSLAMREEPDDGLRTAEGVHDAAPIFAQEHVTNLLASAVLGCHRSQQT